MSSFLSEAEKTPLTNEETHYILAHRKASSYQLKINSERGEMKIIDIHRHYWGKGWDPPSRVTSYVERDGIRTEQIESKYTRDPDGSKMIEEMDSMGIDVAILHTVDSGLAYIGDPPTDIEKINRFHCELVKKYPGRVHALFGIDPRRPGGIKLFEKAVKEWGAIGLSFWPISGFYANDAICYAYYQKCVDLGVPVTCHAGFQHARDLIAKYGNPIFLDEVARDFPDLTIIMCHTGLDKYPSDYWWETAVVIAASKPNIYVDVAGWQRKFNGNVLDDMPELFRKLKIMRNQLGADHILFGTDQPSYKLPNEKSDLELTRRWVELFSNLPKEAKKFGVDFSQEEAELIMHGNAERLLGT